MVFIVLGVLMFLILIVFRTYKTLISVVLITSCIAGVTTVVLAWGIFMLSGHTQINFFSTAIGSSEFYHLITAWYGMDLLCAVVIIRRYREYRAVNRGAGTSPPRS